MVYDRIPSKVSWIPSRIQISERWIPIWSLHNDDSLSMGVCFVEMISWCEATVLKICFDIVLWIVAEKLTTYLARQFLPEMAIARSVTILFQKPWRNNNRGMNSSHPRSNLTPRNRPFESCHSNTLPRCWNPILFLGLLRLAAVAAFQKVRISGRMEAAFAMRTMLWGLSTAISLTTCHDCQCSISDRMIVRKWGWNHLKPFDRQHSASKVTEVWIRLSIGSIMVTLATWQ
jgi:hypothetical protein